MMMRLLRGSFVHFLALATVAFVPASSIATPDVDACAVPTSVTQGRPGNDPTEVGLGIVLVGLLEIRDTDQSFFGDVAVITSWRDPRLAASALGHSLEGCRIEPNGIWHPRLHVANMREVEIPLDEMVVDRNGHVLHRRRVIGSFGATMDLREFPFDEQVIGVSVVSIYGPEELAIRRDDQRISAIAVGEIPGWRRVSGSAAFEDAPQRLSQQDRVLAGARVSLTMKREHGYYLWKVMLPLTLIVFMAWGVFWIDPSNLGPQVGLSTSAALTFVAFQLGLGALLPPIDYLTRIDRFILGSEILVFLALAEAITAARLSARDHLTLARHLDLWSRLAYPAGFVLVLVASFWI